jgi:hypothetical protein
VGSIPDADTSASLQGGCGRVRVAPLLPSAAKYAGMEMSLAVGEPATLHTCETCSWVTPNNDPMDMFMDWPSQWLDTNRSVHVRVSFDGACKPVHGSFCLPTLSDSVMLATPEAPIPTPEIVTLSPHAKAAAFRATDGIWGETTTRLLANGEPEASAETTISLANHSQGPGSSNRR